MKSVVNGKHAGAVNAVHLTRCCDSFAGLGRRCCHRRPSPKLVSSETFGLHGLTVTCDLPRLKLAAATLCHESMGDLLALNEFLREFLNDLTGSSADIGTCRREAMGTGWVVVTLPV
jgi:hypothetical protein